MNMTLLRLLYAVLCCYFSQTLRGESAACCASPAGNYDHLVPINFEYDLKYRVSLVDRLFVSPADCGRVTLFPSDASQGEASVALYVINQANQPAQAHIVYTKADRNLWYALSDANPNRSQEQPISIKRTDLGIPTSTAAAIAHLWRCMLCATRPDERSQNDKIVIHPVVAEFSLVNPDVQALFGQLPRTMGTHTEALYELTKQLITYCEAEPSKRVSLAQKIERDASALAAVVKSEEQTR